MTKLQEAMAEMLKAEDTFQREPSAASSKP
jgi:hypothetical protein